MADDLHIPGDIAARIRAAMSDDQIAEAADERRNVFLAMGEPDTDVLMVLSDRMRADGGTHLDSFALGYVAGMIAATPHSYVGKSTADPTREHSIA